MLVRSWDPVAEMVWDLELGVRVANWSFEENVGKHSVRRILRRLSVASGGGDK